MVCECEGEPSIIDTNSSNMVVRNINEMEWDKSCVSLDTK